MGVYTDSSGDLYRWLDPQERFTLVMKAMARGDHPEAERLRAACPRFTYSMQDAGFNGRLSLAFDTMAVVCIDLRGMWGKLEMLQWSLLVVRRFSTLHHINADFAFMDGERCGRGLPQLDWFARPLPPVEQEPEQGEEEQEADDEPDDDEREPDPEPVRLCGRRRRGSPADSARRMSAVEGRAQHSTDLTCGVISGAAKVVAQDLVNEWAAFDRFCTTRLGITADEMLAAWDFPLDEFRSTLDLYKPLKPDEARVTELTDGMCCNWDRVFSKEA